MSATTAAINFLSREIQITLWHTKNWYAHMCGQEQKHEDKTIKMFKKI